MTAVALSSLGKPLPQAEVSRMGYAARKWWARILGVAVIIAFAVSVPWFPYSGAKVLGSEQHFKVVAQQFSFTLPPSVPSKTPIVFDVTATDVNHGFGIYDPAGKLVAQVQAMPDYVNHLRVDFTTPGKYVVRCLEYCGVAHAQMQSSFEVQ
ncbi:cytochrome c oxidase subunit II [bacterium]|nr:MAG: cytochrome c oxidase subunit II [bacterium]